MAKKKFKEPFLIDYSQERDSVSIVVTDARDEIVAEWHDEEVQDMFEDGFFSSRGFGKSVISYLVDAGVIPKSMVEDYGIYKVLPDFEVTGW